MRPWFATTPCRLASALRPRGEDKKEDPNKGGDDQGDKDGKKDAFDPNKFVSADDFGKTAAKIRGMETSIKDLSTKALTKESLLEALGEVGLVEKDEAGKFKPKGQQAQDTKKDAPDPRIQALETEVGKLTKQVQTKEQELAQERENTKRQNIKQAVITELSKAGAVRPESDYVHIVGQIQMSESGILFVPGEDKYKNEIEIPLTEFCVQFLESRPELKKSSATGGSGTPGGDAGKGGAGKPKVIPYETWFGNPAWYKENRDKFTSGEYKRGYPAEGQ